MAFAKLLKLSIWALLFIASGSALAMILRTPSHDRDWKLEYQRLPKAVVEGDEVRIEGVRDFSYDPKGQISKAAYLDQTYRLSELESLWYGISHFGSFGLAHTFVSFGFADGRHLAISIEARQAAGQNYNPFLGLFGAYELIVVAGTERDIVGLRSHVRGERVLLYKVNIPKPRARDLFLAMLGRMNDIERAPEFYHTITDNCAVAIWRYSNRISAFQRYTNPKLLLPGFSDEVAYELGLIFNGIDIERLRRKALVDPGRSSLDDPLFSEKIRGF